MILSRINIRIKLIFLFLILSALTQLFSWEKEGIHSAACSQNIELLKNYISQGADVNEKDSDGDLPLTLAAQYNLFQNVKFLLESGAKVNKKAGYGITALMVADSLDVLDLLLNNGAEVSNRDREGNDALLHSSVRCNILKADILIRNGADINTENDKGESAIIKAIKYEYKKPEEKIAYIKFLLDNGADIQHRDKKKKTAYVISKEMGHDDIANFLITKGAIAEDFKINPDCIVQALINKEYARAKKMINKDIDFNFLFSDFSPLMCSMDDIEIMKLLIENGADVNLKNKMNMTALTIAVISNKIEAVKLLLDNGAETDIPSTINDKTPIMFAKENRNKEIIELLQKYSKEK